MSADEVPGDPGQEEPDEQGGEDQFELVFDNDDFNAVVWGMLEAGNVSIDVINVLLLHFDGYEVEQIATILDKPERMVKRHRKIGLRAYKRYFKDGRDPRDDFHE